MSARDHAGAVVERGPGAGIPRDGKSADAGGSGERRRSVHHVHYAGLAAGVDDRAASDAERGTGAGSSAARVHKVRRRVRGRPQTAARANAALAPSVCLAEALWGRLQPAAALEPACRGLILLSSGTEVPRRLK